MRMRGYGGRALIWLLLLLAGGCVLSAVAWEQSGRAVWWSAAGVLTFGMLLSDVGGGADWGWFSPVGIFIAASGVLTPGLAGGELAVAMCGAAIWRLRAGPEQRRSGVGVELFGLGVGMVSAVVLWAVRAGLPLPWLPGPERAVGAVVSCVVAAQLLRAVTMRLTLQVQWIGTAGLDAGRWVVEAVLACMGLGFGVLWNAPGAGWLVAVCSLGPVALFYRTLQTPRLEMEAHMDAKCGLYNARYFQVLLGEELQRMSRALESLAYLMIDADHFKRVNDTYGHDAGDIVIRGLGRVVRESIRVGDFAGRFGGEEFAVAAPRTNYPEALVLAERIRSRVELARFAVPGREGGVEEIGVTVSIGVGVFPFVGRSETSLLRAADLAVYAAKTGGRNRVVSAATVGGEVAATYEQDAGRRDRRGVLEDRLARPRLAWEALAPFAYKVWDAVGGGRAGSARRDGGVAVDSRLLWWAEQRRRLEGGVARGERITVGCLAIDEFDEYVRREGAETGQAALEEVAALLGSREEVERVVHYGSASFTFLLPRRVPLEAETLCWNLRILCEDRVGGVGVSIGLGGLAEGERDAAVAYGRAEAAVREAWRRGGRCVVSFGSFAADAALGPAWQAGAVRSVLRGGGVACQVVRVCAGEAVVAYASLVRLTGEAGLASMDEARRIADGMGRRRDLERLLLDAAFGGVSGVPSGLLVFVPVAWDVLVDGGLGGGEIRDAAREVGLGTDRVVLVFGAVPLGGRERFAEAVAAARCEGFRVGLGLSGAAWWLPMGAAVDYVVVGDGGDVETVEGVAVALAGVYGAMVVRLDRESVVWRDAERRARVEGEVRQERMRFGEG